MTTKSRNVLFLIAIAILFTITSYSSVLSTQKITVDPISQVEPLLSPLAILQEETPILRIDNNPLDRFIRKVTSYLKSPETHIFSSLQNCPSLSACPSNRLYSKYLVLKHSYHFFRLSVLKSQSHPPTLFFLN